MSQLTGILVVDAPASALNNAGADTEARTDNAVAVKFIRAPSGQRFPYVSAQAVRFWLRTQLARQDGRTSSPVFRETKVAYTDAEPTKYAEDDLFGYMRAASKSTDEKKAAKRAEIGPHPHRSIPRPARSHGSRRFAWARWSQPCPCVRLGTSDDGPC